MNTIIGQNWRAAAALLNDGALVAIPTETVYGLAGNALNDDAVINIFAVKNRPAFDPLIVHTHSVEKIADFVANVPEKAIQLFDAFSPGPLTILLPKKDVVPDVVTSGLERVAVRIPQHPLTLDLLRGLDFPLAAPSANPFGYISPTTAQHVFDQLGGKIPYILDGGACQVGVESTIVGFEGDDCVVYRLGGLSVERLESVVGKVHLRINNSSNPASPGMLKSHYAPRKPLKIVDFEGFFQNTEGGHFQKLGVLSFQKPRLSANVVANEILSPAGDTHEAARHLFAAMRRLDASDAELIIAEELPESGLGMAINDRLRRAATVD